MLGVSEAKIDRPV